jgi:DNA-binding MarR family transcriptional regulator
MAVVLADLNRFLRDETKRGTGAPHALTPAQFHVLAYVEQETMPTEIEIAQHLHVTSPTMVRLVDTLEEKGLVVRARSKLDRRRVKISVTDEGARIVRDYADWQEQRFAQIVQRLPAKTVTALIRDLTALLAAQEDRRGGS